MYKLILVDDEEEVRKGVLKKIEWDKYGFEVVGEAENGREALEIAEKVFPDVVITDIKMPFMDGIRLSEHLTENFPTTKTIILTGFDEFEYAHKAIKLNVIEYVLKPISSEELIGVLIKTKEQLDKEFEEKRNVQILQDHYKKSIPILKEKFLSTLVTSRLKKEEIEEKARNYNVDFQGQNFIAAIVNVDYDSEQGDYEERDLTMVSVMGIVNEFIDSHNMGTSFINNEKIIVIGVIKEKDRALAINKVMRTFEQIYQSVTKYLNISVTIGIGNLCSNISQINISYNNALSAMDYRMVMRNNNIIWIEDVEPQCKESIIFDELKERELISALKVKNEEEISGTIDQLFNELIDSKTSLKDYQIYLMEIITTILKVAKTSDINTADIFGDNYNLFIELYKFKHLKEVKDWIKEICLNIRKSISQGRIDNCKLIVNGAKEYIEEYYQESDLSINKVCSHLHISTTYFSALFKKETKMTFVNYLTQVRMNAAKEILKNTNLKSFQVAEKVGYSEPNYFSYCFKKYFGVSPSEYRNSN